MLRIDWSPWLDLTEDHIYSVPGTTFGIYRTRLVDGNGNPIPIRRRLGTDFDGIVYIGASGVRGSLSGAKLQNRLTKHKNAHASGKSRKAKDQQLVTLWRKISQRYGSAAWLQFQYCVLGSRDEAKLMEGLVQKEFFAQCGEKWDDLWKDDNHPIFP